MLNTNCYVVYTFNVFGIRILMSFRQAAAAKSSGARRNLLHHAVHLLISEDFSFARSLIPCPLLIEMTIFYVAFLIPNSRYSKTKTWPLKKPQTMFTALHLASCFLILLRGLFFIFRVSVVHAFNYVGGNI